MTKIQTMQKELELQALHMESLWKDNRRLV